MAKKIYYNQDDKLEADPTTGHKGTPIRIIDEFEGQAACKYQLDYLKQWRNYFYKQDYTRDWFENVKVMNRQKGFYKNGQKYYTCQDVFEDNENLCRKYLKNSSRYRHLAKPAFNKTERAIEKGIEIVKKHNHPYTDTSDKLTEAQEMTQIEWIKGIRPSDSVYDRLFDVEKTIDQQESEKDNDKE